MPGKTANFLKQNPHVPTILLTAREAAAALAMSQRTLATLTARGAIPVVRFPGSRGVRYDPDAIRVVIAKLQTSNGQPTSG